MSDRDESFPTTHWTLVQIVKSDDRAQSAKALEAICTRYWYPVYAYLRRSGRSAHDAEDFTQALFEKLVRDDVLPQVQRERGRLRSFLIGVLKQVISRQQRHDAAEKRGGGVTMFSLSEDAGERYAGEPLYIDDPEKLFDRAWARELLETVRSRLKQAFADNQKAREYEVLEPCLGLGDELPPCAELARQLGSAEGKVRVVIHRLRKKFRDMLEQEIAKTVVDPADIGEEMEWMRMVLKY